LPGNLTDTDQIFEVKCKLCILLQRRFIRETMHLT
jgi:hypothetical protein